jgi:hypothetical protein
MTSRRQRVPTKWHDYLPVSATLLMFVLQVTGVIDISWWWILAPIWLPPALILGLLIIVWLLVSILDAFKGAAK